MLSQKRKYSEEEEMQRRDLTQRKGDRNKWSEKKIPFNYFYIKRKKYHRVEKTLQLYQVQRSKPAHHLHMLDHLHLQQQPPALQKKGSPQRKWTNETIKWKWNKRVGRLDEKLFKREQKQSESPQNLRVSVYVTELHIGYLITEPVWWLGRFVCADIGEAQRLHRSWGVASGSWGL